jgi:hypothetical protein
MSNELFKAFKASELHDKNINFLIDQVLQLHLYQHLKLMMI